MARKVYIGVGGQSKLCKKIYVGIPGTPTTPQYTFTLSGVNSSVPLQKGAHLLSNGLVYCNPSSIPSNVGLYDPIANTYTLGPVAGGFSGSAITPDRNFVFPVPYAATQYGVYTVSTNTYTTLGSLTRARFGIIVNNAFLYMGTESSGLFELNITNSATRTIAAPGNRETFADMCELSDGRLFLGAGVSSKNALLYNRSNDTWTQLDMSGILTTTNNHQNAFVPFTVLPDGRVVLTPYLNDKIVLFDPTTSSFSAGPTATGYYGACLLPSGKVLMVPWTATNIGIYDPATNTLEQGPAATGYMDAVLVSPNKVVLVPLSTTTNFGIVTINW